MHTLHAITRTAAAATLALASLAAQADVAAFSQSGRFLDDAAVHSFQLSIATASDLRLWTTSYAAGQLDPVLALFDWNSGALLSLSDDIDAPVGQVDPSQGALDAGLWLTGLAPGQYRVAVSLSPNLPAGSSWAEGYGLPAAGGLAVDTGWHVEVALSNAAPVPEPAPTALLLAGLATLAWTARRRR